MSNGLVIRSLDPMSLDRAAELHELAFAPLGERAWTRQELAGLLAQPGTAGLLVHRLGKDVGFALSRVASDEAEVLTIVVDPTERRRGAGRALLAAVIASARASGSRHLFLEVAADNAAARALYEQAGFEVVGQRASYYQRTPGPRVDGVVMCLGL
jgi:ribosomal-protein-alanine N-acetyltransferase